MKQLLRASALSVLLSLSLGAQTTTDTQAAALIKQAQDALTAAQQLLAAPAPVPVPVPVPVPTPTPVPTGTVTVLGPTGNLQNALNIAQPGDTIKLTAGATYTGNFILPAKSGTGVITITTTGTLPSGRIGPANAALLPKLKAPAGGAPPLVTAPGAHHYALVGLEFLPNPGGFGDLLDLGDGSTAQNTLTSVPHDLVVDRCYLHGDPTVGQKRGIALNSASTTISNSYISDIKLAGQDTQAIFGSNGPGPYTITNNYLEAAGENLLFGGDDPKIPNLVPSDISVTGNTLNKPMTWRTQAWQIKNLLELKNARRVVIDSNTLTNIWGQAQIGYAVQFTPRNQDGGCPWCTVEDVTFSRNTVSHMAAAINLLGTDDGNPSQRLSRVTIRGNTFSDVDPWGYAGSDKLFQVLAGPVDVTIDANTATGIHIGSVLYFDGTPQALRLVVTNNRWPTSLYGIFGGNSSTGGTPPHAWTDYVSGGTLSGNVETP